MGKRLEDLKLSNDPILTPTPTGSTDPRGEAWYQFVEEIDDLLATGRYTWAQDTLTSIQTTVEETKRVTDGQRRAVANIEAGARRGDGSRSRRYEGFGR